MSVVSHVVDVLASVARRPRPLRRVRGGELVEVEAEVKPLDENPFKSPGRAEWLEYVAVDGSSRTLPFTSLVLFIASVGVYDVRRRERVYPTLYGQLRRPFLALKAPKEVLEEVEEKLKGVVIVKSPAGDYYDEDYDEEHAASELRAGLETWALEELAEGQAVVVDGPVYFAYPGVYRGDDPRVRAQRALLQERIEALKRRELVVGVVKRVENAHLLSAWAGLEGHNDAAVVEHLAHSRGVDRLLLGPFLASYKTGRRGSTQSPAAHPHSGGLELPDKVFWYVYIKTPIFSKVFRIEVLKEHYDKGSLAEELAGYLASKLSERGLPLGVDVADRLAKLASAAIFKGVFEAGLFKGLSPAHDAYEHYAALQTP